MEDTQLKDLKDGMGNAIAPTDISKADELGPVDLSKLVKAITPDEVTKIISVVESVTKGDFSALEFSIFDYVGFDPLMVSRVIRVYQNHYKDSDDNVLSDIKFSVAACLYMGNLQTKSTTRRVLEGRSKIEYLTRKYNIRVGSQGTGIPAEALTFPRIAAAYPVLAIRMAASLTPKTVQAEFQSVKIPPGMRLTPFASLCSPHMDPELRLFLQEACNAHGSDMAIAYERGRLKKAKREVKYNPVTIALDQWAFIEVASSSPVPTEAAKKKMLLELDLIKHHKSLAEVVANYRSIMSNTVIDVSQVLSEELFTTRIGDYVASTS